MTLTRKRKSKNILCIIIYNYIILYNYSKSFQKSKPKYTANSAINEFSHLILIELFFSVIRMLKFVQIFACSLLLFKHHFSIKIDNCHLSLDPSYVCMYVCMYVMYVCMYVCTCMYSTCQ